MIRKIADQSEQERKRKQELDKIFDPTGHTPPRKTPKGGGKERRVRFRKKGYNGSDDSDDDDGPEEDQRRENPNVNPDWKMDKKEFKKIVGPYVSDCPKMGRKLVCALYNIVGFCFFGSQCRHLHDERSDDTKEEFEKWLNACKKKAKGGKKGNDEKKKGKE
jgi:hypothetical protein